MQKNIQLGILAFFTITGLVLMFKTSQELQANVAFIDLQRSQAPLITDFNPCADVPCGPGQTATFVGTDDTATKITEFPTTGNTLCKCTDSRTFITRPKTPRRY
ncbi:hypothetical protein HY484_00560 [Candidatus Woesearchaeota archaeon]|nr:hypothetical protein [Candidatus Woesearchaeota archaeon]